MKSNFVRGFNDVCSWSKCLFWGMAQQCEINNNLLPFISWLYQSITALITIPQLALFFRDQKTR